MSEWDEALEEMEETGEVTGARENPENMEAHGTGETRETQDNPEKVQEAGNEAARVHFDGKLGESDEENYRHKQAEAQSQGRYFDAKTYKEKADEAKIYNQIKSQPGDDHYRHKQAEAQSQGRYFDAKTYKEKADEAAIYNKIK